MISIARIQIVIFSCRSLFSVCYILPAGEQNIFLINACRPLEDCMSPISHITWLPRVILFLQYFVFINFLFPMKFFSSPKMLFWGKNFFQMFFSPIFVGMFFKFFISKYFFSQFFFFCTSISKILIVPGKKMKKISGKKNMDPPLKKKKKRLSNITAIDWQGVYNILWTWRELYFPSWPYFPSALRALGKYNHLRNITPFSSPNNVILHPLPVNNCIVLIEQNITKIRESSLLHYDRFHFCSFRSRNKIETEIAKSSFTRVFIETYQIN